MKTPESRVFLAIAVVAVAHPLFTGTRSVAQAQNADTPKADPILLNLPSQPPRGAIVLFSGKPRELSELWLKRRTQDPAGWKVENGAAIPADKTDIVTRQEFGDFYLHVEFRTPKDGGGNAGVAPHGRYEVQIFNSYGKEAVANGCGALYSQKPPRVVASKAPGEWQTYDIFFRAPRFDDKGEVTEKPRATVIQNGILIQNNAEFNGMTGIQYEQYGKMTPTGPLVLQGDHDPVQFRNIWVVPL